MASRPPDVHSPPVPVYTFRGHVAAIHALHFFTSNGFLASGDSEGWLVVWSVASKRAVAVWKAHEGGILGVKDWGYDRLITHGRDHKLRVWRMQHDDFGILTTKLPVDGADAQTERQPWLLHSMDVNALNFCAFATCYYRKDKGHSSDKEPSANGIYGPHGQDNSVGTEPHQPIFIAAPNGLDSGGIDFFHLPSERRASKLPSDQVTKTGMVMTLSIFYNSTTETLTVVSGYEDGHTMVHVRRTLLHATDEWSWQKVLVSKPHSQPVLSLDASWTENFYLTSSADAVIAKFSIPSGTTTSNLQTKPTKTVNSKHAGQQGLCVRSDGKIFATAGWDKQVRVYSAKTLKELAVLKWHKEGCYAIAFADTDPLVEINEDEGGSVDVIVPKKDGLSALDLIKKQRDVKARNTHWLAAGGKDGKISLWDIY